MRKFVGKGHRVLLGVSPVPLMFIAQVFIEPATFQLWVLVMTGIMAVLFITAYIPEKPHESWLGTSLLLLAFSVSAVVLAAMLNRTIGPGFPGLQILVTLWIGLMFSSLTMRTWALINIQIHRREGLGWWLHSHHIWPWATKEPAP